MPTVGSGRPGYVGTQDATRILTPDEKAALAGTDGTPDASNPFVTDSDPRLGVGSGNVNAAGTLTAHQVVLGDGSTDVVVLGSLGTAGDVLTSQGAGNDPIWDTPTSGSGALVLLEQHTASASASLTFTTAISSTYDTYFFVLTNLIPASGNANVVMEFSTDGGSTWIVTTYAGSLIYQDNNGNTGVNNGVTTNIRLNENYASTTTAHGGVTGHAYLFSPLSTAFAKFVTFKTININGSDSALYSSEGGGWNSTTSAVNAVRFKFKEAGGTDRNMASGTVLCYGVAK